MTDSELPLHLGRMIARAELNTASDPSPHRSLARVIKQVAELDPEPLLALGVLVEGIVHILTTAVVPTQQREAADGVRMMLTSRLTSRALIPQDG